MTVEHRGARAMIQAALTAGEDPTAKARSLKSLHQTWVQGTRIPEVVRPVVARSWSRAGAIEKEIVPLAATAVQDLRESNEQLLGLVELFKERLLSLATQAGNQLVISDGQGYVLWVLGPSMVRRQSDGIGFVSGARWRESDVGTNGIGAAMAERVPVQIFGPEHAREEQHSWVCTSAPVISPINSALVGTVTLAGSYKTAHPHSLALVSSVVKEAESKLLIEHAMKMQRLELSSELPEGEYLLVDHQGFIAASRGIGATGKVHLPPKMLEGRCWVDGLGSMDARPTAGGWILTRTTEQISLELCPGPERQAIIHCTSDTTLVPLGERHWQIIDLLYRNARGVNAEQLRTLWPPLTPQVTIRAEISRLRAKLPGLIASRPYRLAVPAFIQQ